MKLIRKAKLFFHAGNSDKVYEVDLCDLGVRSGGKRYVVNFRYGRRGRPLRESTKTVSPVTLDEANEIFDSVVVSKTNRGYQQSATVKALSTTADSNATDTSPGMDKRAQIVLERITAARQKAISAREVKRSVWRAGELGLSAAAPQLVSLIATDDALLDYCIAWSLGRCGDPSAIPALHSLQKRHGLDFVGRMAREAILSLADSSERETIFNEIKKGLPHSLVGAIEAGESARIVGALDFLIQTPTPSTVAILADLYALARDDQAVHDALCALVPGMRLQPNIFKAIRQIFKAAEFRFDSRMYGLIVHRIDTSAPYYRRPDYGDGAYSPQLQRYTSIAQEMKKEDPGFAYSDRTRAYFRRRSWRTLQRLGQLASDRFVLFAANILLAVHDTDARPGEGVQFYDSHLARYVTRVTDSYAYFYAFNHILNLNNPRVNLSNNRSVWLVDEAVAEVPGFRCEAFPELWDKQPLELLRLLIDSQCGAVHIFAVRAVRCNQSFVNGIDSHVICKLLAKPYDVTARFALELAASLVRTGSIDKALLLALLCAFLEEARQLARDLFIADPEQLLDESDLMFAIITSVYEDNRLWMRRFAADNPSEALQIQPLIVRLIAHIIKIGEEEADHQALIGDIGWMLLNVYGQSTRRLGFDVIDDLLSQQSEAVQLLAARLLLNHATPAAQLPPAQLRKLMEAESAEVRGLGVQLFGRLPDDALLAQPDLVVALVVSNDRQVRQAARPIVRRLAQVEPEFARQALSRLLGYLFRAESSEGFHQDILDLVQRDLDQAAQALDVDTTWRLLQSRSKTAQRYGAHLLQRFAPEDFSVRQLGRLGGNPILAVRRWGWRGFEQDVNRIRHNAQDALVILDANWEDARQFAYSFFDQYFSEGDWNPELLVTICDSLRDDVQHYGRELIMRFFSEQDGVQYLLQLSQHPSANVQLFVTNFLSQYAAGSVDHLRKLRPYFVTILSKVNQARVTKTRITRFLREEAMKSREIAEMVADIFSRQSVTSAIGDKAACIEILLDIHRQYPGIETPLQLVPIAGKSATEPQPHGVEG